MEALRSHATSKVTQGRAGREFRSPDSPARVLLTWKITRAPFQADSQLLTTEDKDGTGRENPGNPSVLSEQALLRAGPGVSGSNFLKSNI